MSQAVCLREPLDTAVVPWRPVCGASTPPPFTTTRAELVTCQGCLSVVNEYLISASQHRMGSSFGEHAP